MIVSAKEEHYDGSWRIVLYDRGSDGRCRPSYTRPELDDHIDSYYVQRALEFERLQRALLAREISPLAFFVQYHNLEAGDVAARTRIRKSAVKRHLTADGFDSATVDELKRYARVFDIGVADFFEFTYLPEGGLASVERLCDRLIQKVQVTAGPPSPEGPVP